MIRRPFLVLLIVSLFTSATLIAEEEYYLPQIANGTYSGGSFTTSFVFFNPNISEVEIQLTLTDDAGEPLRLGLGSLGVKSNFLFTLEPGGSRMFESGGKGSLIVGAARVRVSSPIGVSAIFTVRDTNGRFTTEAGVGPSEADSQFIIPVDALSGFNTGFALFNPQKEEAIVTLQLFGTDGSSLASTQLELPGNGHLARFIAGELFPDLTDFQGRLAVYSSHRIAAVTLRQHTGPLNFTTLPVVSFSSEQTEFTLPQVANGTGSFGAFKTTFILFGLSSVEAAQVNLSLSADDGSPLEVSLLGIKSDSHALEVPPGGALFLETDGFGPLNVGAARITSSVAIGVSGIFTVLDTDRQFETEAGVGSSLSFQSLTLPVQEAALQNTGLALFNPNEEPAQLNMQLQNPDGSTHGKTSRIVLGSGAHIARFISELFEEVDEFEGSLAIHSSVPVSAVTLRQNAEPVSFTTLPVAPDAHGFTQLTIQKIGSQGGLVFLSDFQLSVPSEAFDSDHNITIKKSDAFSAFGSETTPAFLIEGLPLDCAEALQIRLKYDENPGELPLLAIGMETFVSSLGQKRATFSVSEASFSSGFLVGEIRLLDPFASDNGDTEPPEDGSEETVNLIVVGVFGWEKHTSKNFAVYAANLPENSIELVKDALEDAWRFFGRSLRFDYEARNRWPVKVAVRSLNTPGYYSNSYQGINYGFMELDRRSLEQEEEFRTRVGHEFCHLVQGLYDPRHRWEKARLQPVFHWFNEAVAVWSEKYFYFPESTERSRYIPPSFNDQNENRVFSGIEAGRQGEGHGPGMAAVLETYASGNHMRKLVNVYQELNAGVGVVDALLQNRLLNDWWWRFWQNYIELATIYTGRTSDNLVQLPQCGSPSSFMEFPCTPWLIANSQGLDSKSEAIDSVHQFTVNLPELSAGYYHFNLDLDPSWPFKIRYRAISASEIPFENIQIVPMELNEEDFSFSTTANSFSSRNMEGLCVKGGCEPVNGEWIESSLSPLKFTDPLRQHPFDLGFLVINGTYDSAAPESEIFDIEIEFNFPSFVQNSFPKVRVDSAVFVTSDGSSKTDHFSPVCPDQNVPLAQNHTILEPNRMTIQYNDVMNNSNLYSGDARVEFDPNTKTLDARWTYRVSDPADSRIFEEWSAELNDLLPDSSLIDDYYSLLERGTYHAEGDLCPYLKRLGYKKQTVSDGEIEMEELESFDCSSGTITTSLPELYFPSRE